jgi:hypothetical protein
VNALSKKLIAFDVRFRSITPERYAPWLLLPSCVIILALGPALFLWGADGPFRVHIYPQATLIWTVSLPLVFFSYEGMVVVWRSRFRVPAKIAFSFCHLSAIALSLLPIVVFCWIIWAIAGVDHDR